VCGETCAANVFMGGEKKGRMG